jgi:1-deoxy-D-xylulose-5-phosphate reductoisomerase
VETIMTGAPTVTGNLTLDQVLEADAEARRLTSALIK